MDSHCQGLVVGHRLLWPLEWPCWAARLSHGGHKVLNTAEWNNDLLVLRGNAVLLKIGNILIDLIETPLDSIDRLWS